MQILATVFLVFGVITGEAVSVRVFGFAKKWYLNLFEVVLFVFILINLFNLIYVQENDYYLLTTVNYFLGLLTIIFTKGVTSAFGFISNKIIEKQKLKLEPKEEMFIYGLTRNLLNNGLGKREIRNVLGNSGFNKRKINNVVKNINLSKKELTGTERN